MAWCKPDWPNNPFPKLGFYRQSQDQYINHTNKDHKPSNMALQEKWKGMTYFRVWHLVTWRSECIAKKAKENFKKNGELSL